MIIPNIQPASDLVLQHGTYILISEAAKKPPHLSLLVEGKIFSLSVKGPQLEFPLEKQLKLIKIKKINALFIKLDTSIYIIGNQLFKEAENNTLKFSKIEIGIATCLSPIKDFCARVFDMDVSNIDFVFDLLPILYKKKYISACYHYNMEKILINNSFHFQKYTMQDIYESVTKFQPADIL